MKLTAAASSLTAVLVATAAAMTTMTATVSASASTASISTSTGAVSATATALSHRATAAKRSLLDINDPNDHELHASSADDAKADELNAATSGDDDTQASAAARHGRRLAYSGPTATVLDDFGPLECNAGLACDAATPLSAAIASAAGAEVKLTCGTCYTVDQTGDVAIPGGLNIE